MLEKLKSGIIKILCRHEWEQVEQGGFSETFNGSRAECFFGTFKCQKCGKMKREFKRVEY